MRYISKRKRNKHKLHHVRRTIVYSFFYSFILYSFCCVLYVFVAFCAFHFCWQNEWVGNLLITYVSCVFISLVFFLLLVFWSVCRLKCILGAVCAQTYFLDAGCYCWFAAAAIHLWFFAAAKFIADLLAESCHHYHLSRVHLLFCSLSSISCGDFGTKFWFAVRLGTMRERFRCVVFVSGND